MYFTDESMLPENQQPLMITVAPYGPQWMPSDYPEDIPVSWDAQVQKAVDCYNAGATVLHLHVRDPETGRISKKLSEYGYLIGRLREAVPKMVIQVGGSVDQGRAVIVRRVRKPGPAPRSWLAAGDAGHLRR